MSKAGVSNKWDNDYEPYEHRKIKDGLTNTDSFIHVLKGCIGTGLLALPQAFYFTGMIYGMFFFVIVSIFGTYCFHIMVRSQYHLCKYKNVPVLTYAESMVVAFEIGPDIFKGLSTFAGHLTNIFFIIYQLGAMCIYLLFTGQHLQLVVNEYVEDPLPLYLFILSLFPICVFVCCVKNMKVFVPFSIFADIVTFVTLIVLAYYVSRDLPEFSSRPAMGEWLNFPLAFGTALFAVQSVPVVIAVENAMNDGKFFLAPFGTLNVGFGIVIILYLITGVMGYWKYGADIKSSITFNFPPEEHIAQAIGILYGTAIIVSYGLVGIIPFQIIWNQYVIEHLEKNGTGEMKKMFYEYLIRISLVIFTFIISITIPLLGPVISLIGGVALSAIGIIFPALLEMCALWPDGLGSFRWIFWKDILIIIIGFIGFGSSMYASVRDIINGLSEQSSFEK